MERCGTCGRRVECVQFAVAEVVVSGLVDVRDVGRLRLGGRIVEWGEVVFVGVRVSGAHLGSRMVSGCCGVRRRVGRAASETMASCLVEASESIVGS